MLNYFSSGTPADKENYTLFLKAVRDHLDALEAETGKFYGLTAGESSHIQPKIQNAL